MDITSDRLMQLLEARRLRTSLFYTSVLYIEGTNRSDRIDIQLAPHQAGVEDRIQYNIVVSKTLVDQGEGIVSAVSQIVVRASRANDRLTVDPNLAVPVGFADDEKSGVTLNHGALVV